MARRALAVAVSAPYVQLTEKYRPRHLADFQGHDSIRRILAQLVAVPFDSAWFFLGASGTGKTSMALAVSEALGGELFHVPSRLCDLETVGRIVSRCAYQPMNGGRHVILIDEADRMTSAAQLAFLSVLDSINAVMIFTANDTKLIEDRFLSRCRLLRFETKNLAPAAVQFLGEVWTREGGAADRPDMAGLFRKSGSNLRTALMNLELLLTDPTLEIPEPVQVVAISGKSPKTRAEVDPARRAAALRAWVTMRARRAGGTS